MGKGNKYQKIVDFLKQYEGFKDSVYLDGNGIPTIGYGFTDSALIKKGKITRAEADKRLIQEIQNIEKDLSKRMKHWDKLSDDSKTSLISYKYNFPAGFKDTTRFMTYWNNEDYPNAIKQVDAGMNDKNNRGLRKRRLAEQALLNSDPFLNKNTDNKPINQFTPVDWSQSEKRIVPIDISTPPAKPVHTDVPMKAEAPDMLSMWNSPDSYAYGGTTPRVPDVQEVNSRINHDILNMIGIDPTINKFQIPFAPKYDKGKNATVRTLPRFDDGTPTTVGPYNIYPSALRPTNQDIPYSVTTPEINIYGQDKRPLYQRYDAYGSTYDPNAIRSITDWLPGIGDVSQGFDAYNAFNEGNYLQAGMLGALMFAPNALEPITKPILKTASKFKSLVRNLGKETPSPIYGNGSYSALSRRWEPDELKMLSKNNPIRDLYGTNYDQYPEDIKNSIYNSVYNRMNSLRNDPEFAKNFADAFTEKYTTYSGEPFEKAYGGDVYGGMYFDNTDHIAIRDGNTDYALGHETVHQLDSKLGRIPKEKAFLEDAFDSDFLKGATELERSTTNYDSRKAFLGKMIDSKSSVKTQNEIIDAATDEEVFAAVENANKYGKRYIAEKRKAKKLNHLLAERIKESWKKVGVAAAPMIPAGTALWMEAKDFKKEDLDNSINNLRALVEGVGLYNKKK